MARWTPYLHSIQGVRNSRQIRKAAIEIGHGFRHDRIAGAKHAKSRRNDSGSALEEPQQDFDSCPGTDRECRQVLLALRQADLVVKTTGTCSRLGIRRGHK